MKVLTTTLLGKFAFDSMRPNRTRFPLATLAQVRPIRVRIRVRGRGRGGLLHTPSKVGQVAICSGCQP